MIIIIAKEVSERQCNLRKSLVYKTTPRDSSGIQTTNLVVLVMLLICRSIHPKVLVDIIHREDLVTFQIVLCICK